jgi:chromosome partitioning protein
MLVRTADDAGASTSAGAQKSAYVIVVGNEKGGSGKSTIAVHVAVSLLKAGYRVATIDLDSHKKTLTHFVDHRRAWAKRCGIALETPDHYCVAEAEGIRRDANEVADRDALIHVVASVEHAHDFLLIDTPGADSYLMRLALGMADTLITPLNDSFVDFDLLGTIDPLTYALIEPSDYAKMVCDERRERHKFDHSDIKWIVIRNRLSNMRSRSTERLRQALNELGLQLAFRCEEGLTERVIYRDFLPRGMTVLDEIGDPAPGRRHVRSHENARQEVQALIATLNLPIDEKARGHAAARAEWLAVRDTRLDLGEIVK